MSGGVSTSKRLAAYCTLMLFDLRQLTVLSGGAHSPIVLEFEFAGDAQISDISRTCMMDKALKL